MPDGIDEAVFTARIEAGNAALREAGFDVVTCLIDTYRRWRTDVAGEHFAVRAAGQRPHRGGTRSSL
jgi:hypothetical protein